jgi:hypothetical protein
VIPPTTGATPAELLAGELRRDPGRPLVTSYDETTGERVELSVATVANWVAKLGNAMTDEWALDSGDTVSVDLPPHWVGAVASLAVWAVGADLVDAHRPATAAVTVGLAPELTDRSLVVTLAPMGLDLSGLVASWPDQPGWISSPAGAVAVGASGTLALPVGARLLSALPFDGPDAASMTIVAALAAAGSLVTIRSAGAVEAERLQRISAAEQVTHSLGINAPGSMRLR